MSSGRFVLDRQSVLVLGSAQMPPIPPENPPTCPEWHPIPTDLEAETHHIGYLVRHGICRTCFAQKAARDRKDWAWKKAKRGYEVVRSCISMDGIVLPSWCELGKEARDVMTGMWMAPD